MSTPNTPYKLSLIPPPGPAVLSLRGPSASDPPPSSIPQLFYDALAIRDVVFGIGQNCPYDEEIDADDPTSCHWVLYVNEGSIPAATIRLALAQPDIQAHTDADKVEDGKDVIGYPTYENSKLWDGKEPFATIGRLATKKEWRGRGYAGVLMDEAIKWARANLGEVEGWKGLLLIHAQEQLRGWYEGSGWQVDEGLGRWDEVGIMHVGMWRRAEA